MISIAMATYNGEKYLREQLDSILNQTYSDFELVVCDDCSKDSTVAILQEYAIKDTRIKIHINDENLGFKKNFEKAILLCQGEYIALSDQDDIWEIWKLEVCCERIKSRDLICTNAQIIAGDGTDLDYTMKDVLKIKDVPANQDLIFKHLIFTNFVQGSTILARRDFLLKTLPLPTAMSYHDYWFAINASISNGITYLDKCSIRYRKHSNQLTRNKNESFLEEITNRNPQNIHLKICDSHLEDLDVISNIPSLTSLQLSFIQETKSYYYHMKNKNFYTLKYFTQNYGIIFFDDNIPKKIIRIVKRFFGLIKYKIYHWSKNNDA